MTARPRVSVLIPYLRAEGTIERALESVLNQSLADLEVVAVADGSTDGTAAIVERYARRDARVRTLRLATNHGPSYARNRGLEAAAGEWIAVLDADDWFAPDRLEAMTEAADDAPIIVDNLVGIDPADASEVGPLFGNLPPRLTVEAIAERDVPGSRFDFGYLKPLFRRDFAIGHGLRYIEHLRTAEDLLFLLEFGLASGPIRTLDRGTYFYNLPVSPTTRRTASTSHSLPVDRLVASALQDLMARNATRLTTPQRVAIDRRSAGLVRDADVATFRHAVRSGAYLKAATLIAASARVRTYLVAKLAGRAAT